MMASLDGFTASEPTSQTTSPQPQDLPAQSTANGAAPIPVSSGPSAEGPDNLSQGKEKARAVLAAGLRPTPTPPSHNPSKSPANADARSNNATPTGRKRSRSGSRVDKKPSTEYKKLVIDQYTSRDQLNAASRIRDQERFKVLEEELAEERRILEEWHQRKHIEAQRRPTRTVYPSQKRPPANRKTKTLRVSGKNRQEQAEQNEDLCPVRLDIEFEKLRLRDTFTWNVHDRVVPPELFVHGLVEDFKIPPEAASHFYQEAHKSLIDQVEDFHPHPYIFEDSLDPELPYASYKNDEMRVQIKLNITIGQHQLTDQFDWDINNPMNSPEQFARQMAKDMSLSGDFTTAIAASIHEQIQPYTKALYMAGHEFDGRPVEASDIRDQLLQSPLPSPFRTFTSAKDCTPAFFELDEKNQYAQELSYDREQRQQKRSGNRGVDARSGRGGGLSLPDLKERPQVNRTRVVSSVIPGAAESVEKSGIYRMATKKKRPWNAGRGMGATMAEDSDDSLEASSSEGESPIRGAGHLLGGGTSRTRGMRGAAAAAQSAMRRNYNERSPSPENAAPARPPVTKTTSLRFQADPIYEEYDDEDGERTCLVVKMKVPRERFRQWWREWKRLAMVREQEAQMRAKRQQVEMLQQAQAQQRASATPVPGGLMGPPSTPGMSGRGLPASGGTPRPGSRLGMSEGAGVATPTPPPGATYAPNPAVPPPPPAWLINAASNLAQEFPQDRFEPVMRMNKEVPDGHPAQWQPRIRCQDCPGTLFNVEENDMELKNFRSHLRFSRHVRARDDRLVRAGGA